MQRLCLEPTTIELTGFAYGQRVQLMESLLFAHGHPNYRLTGFHLSLRLMCGSPGLCVPWRKLTLLAALEEQGHCCICVQVMRCVFALPALQGKMPYWQRLCLLPGGQ